MSRRLQGALVALVLAVTTMLMASAPASALGAPSTPSVTGSIGADAVSLTWPSVSGASGYQVQYSRYSSFSSPAYKAFAAGSGSSQVTTMTGLKTKVTYHFRVRTYDLAAKKATSSWSGSRSVTTRYTYGVSSHMVANNVGGTSVGEWVNVSGAPGWRLRASASGRPTLYQSGGSSTVMTFKGLRKGTTYKFSVAVEEPATATTPGIRLGAYSSGIYVRTSNYPLAAPTDLVVSNQQPYQVDLAWTPGQPLGATDTFRIDYGRNAAITDSPRSVYSTSPRITLKNLTRNTQYYVRVRVVTADTHAARSDRSDYVMARTRIPWGYLKGTVACGSACGDVVAAAIKGTAIQQQVSVRSDGSYTLQVRPTTYRVLVTYLGTGNRQSLWVSGSVPGGASLAAEASIITVALNANVHVPAVTLNGGGTVTGVVRDENAQSLRSIVDIAAIDAGGRVVVTHQNGPDGRYTITGLPPGTYTVRFNYIGIGYQVASRKVTVSGDTATADARLALVTSWWRPYGAYGKNSKTVGTKLIAQATPWRPTSMQPFARADAMYVRWKRNGVAITSWCLKTTARYSCSYTPTRSDRGTYLQVQAKAVHVGYVSGYATSSRYRIK